jgi:hypothetical protein
MRNRSFAVLAFALASACSFERFHAAKTVDYALPLAGVQRLACQTHNGGITVIGDATATEIALHAEITASAPSQVEADTLLNQLDVVRDVADGGLTVHGNGPDSDWRTSSVFSFTITLPPQAALELQSHNGALRIRGATGAVSAETHNGEITAEVGAGDLNAVTHNGDVRLTFRGGGLRQAVAESHNGEITIDLGPDQDLRLEAETHNGRVRNEMLLQDPRWRGSTRSDGRHAQREDNHVTGQIGAGTGSLRVTTHNGDITLK